MIPFVDLKTQYQNLKAEIDDAIQGVLSSSSFILGPAVANFEEAFAPYCEARYCIAVNSGTSALHLALLAAGIGQDDEVITVPYTFVATVAAIEYSGARPVLVDIDPKTYTMDPAKVEAAITPRTRAIVPVHLYGHPADLDPIATIARKYGLKLIEDACQAHGARYKGRRVGSIGDLAAFSFYPGKNLGAYGEGGAVTTNSAEHAEKIRLLRDWGAPKRYHHALKGYNYRMDGIQGAILGVKLRYLDEWTEIRRRHAARYSELLSGTHVATPETAPWAEHVFHIYALRATDRAELHQALIEQGIQAGMHYPICVHEQEGYRNLGYKRGDFPIAESVAREELSLPIYPELTGEQLKHVTDAVLQFAAPAYAAGGARSD